MTFVVEIYITLDLLLHARTWAWEFAGDSHSCARTWWMATCFYRRCAYRYARIFA